MQGDLERKNELLIVDQPTNDVCISHQSVLNSILATHPAIALMASCSASLVVAPSEDPSTYAGPNPS
jgi:ATPase subunit of ABC transporter with duplicated ATPase domains